MRSAAGQALCQALHRWYPKAEIIGIDRDKDFIDFAEAQAPDICFLEDDAVRLSFDAESFDVTIYNTVAEHVEPKKFFEEQRRVLKPGGVCLVLSSRCGINIMAPCISEISAFEKEIWKRTQERCAEVDREYGVCAYPMSEAEYPKCMEAHGFRSVTTDYLTINLTPDNPTNSAEEAHAMIRAQLQIALDGIDRLGHIASDLVSKDEISEMNRLANARYDKRLALYDAGVKQWDTSVSVTMVLRGIV